MNEIGILCDFHGTLVDANAAWIEAFKAFGVTDIDVVIDRVYKKTNRKIICREYGLDYAALTAKYREFLSIRPSIVRLVKDLSRGRGIIIVSNSSRERLLLDIDKVKNALGIEITEILSKENGNKNDVEYIESVLNRNNFEKAYLIGNDIREDFNKSDRIINIFVPYKETISRNDNL